MRLIKSIRSLVVGGLSLVVVMLALSAASVGQIGVGVSVSFGPPALPVYDQPICPGDGYLWTPGYWAWDPDFGDYYWVPGTWVLAPEVGFLWTPPWWGWGGGGFLFHEGFWGPTIGFYGGIDYGFGYFGVGFEGGRWENGHFFYNTAVMHVNTLTIRNVYETRINNITVNHVSYNGGEGGTVAHPTAVEEAAANERHVGPVADQTRQMQTARGNPQMRASQNQGRPPVAATARPGEFTGGAAIPAREAGGEYHPPANRGNEARAPEANGGKPAPVHARDLTPMNRPAAPNTGNAKLDRKYQKQQDKLAAQQDKERQQLQKQQDKEHQQSSRQKNAAETNQQMEQRHQQQTQELQQKHTAEQQQLQERQQPRGGSRR